MRQHAFQFFVIQQVQDALGHGDRRMLRIASGGESVRRIGWNHVNLRHGQADLLRQPLDHLVYARQLLARDRLGAVGAQRNLVGKEIGDEVHHRGNAQSEQHAVLAAEGAADGHQQQRHRGEQKRGLERVSHKSFHLPLDGPPGEGMQAGTDDGLPKPSCSGLNDHWQAVARPTAGGTLSLLHGGALEGAFQRLVQRGFGFLVFLLRDASLLVLHFELEQLFLQGFEEQGGTGWQPAGWTGGAQAIPRRQGPKSGTAAVSANGVVM